PEPEPDPEPEVSETVQEPEQEQPEPVRLSIVADPGDAAITVSSGERGTGSLTLEVEPGSEVQIEAVRAGFSPIRRTITAGGGNRTYELNLEPRPIESVVPVSRNPLVRGLAVAGSVVVGADGDGTLAGASNQGSPAWSVSSANGGNENSEPVAGGGQIYFSGAAELLAINPAGGAVTGRRQLSNTESHLFGRQAVFARGRLYVPTDESVLLLDPSSLEERGSLPIPGGSKMSPAIAGDSLIIGDQQGALVVLNADTGETVHTISTGAAQPVAIAPVVSGSTAVIVGRRGTVAAADYQQGSLLWETPLTGDAERGVFTNPVSDGRRLFVHARQTMYVLNLSDGTAAYGPFEDAATSPLVKDGRIYYGSRAGELVVRRASNGTTLARLDLPSVATTRPVDLGERIAVGTREGEIIYIHPAGIR
ncbi:MAG: PQQ-binding-like beta-propeller repeat protein, partial [Alkalispirochaetaceae bacterium]